MLAIATRRLDRLMLAGGCAASLAMTLWSGAEVARNPMLAPVVARTADEIAAAADRALAARATPEHLSGLIAARLADDPRNWVALTALRGLAEDRGIALPPATVAAYDAAWEEDTGLFAQVGDCAACAWDPAACSLSNVLVCQAPVAFTPIGDVAGIARAGLARATGGDVDEIDLALSVVGLGATAVILASGGTSATVKLGASIARMARRMGLVSPRLTALALDSVRRGVDWAALPAIRSLDDVRAALRMDAFAPLTSIAADVGRIGNRLDGAETLHLVRLIDDAPDARRLAALSEALGPRTVATAEVLGKSRFLRIAVRLSDVAIGLVAGLVGLTLTLAGMIGGLVQGLAFRALGKLAGPLR
jgi:hypothetical protein